SRPVADVQHALIHLIFQMDRYRIGTISRYHFIIMEDFDIGGGEADGSTQLLAFDDDTVEFEVPAQAGTGDVHPPFGKGIPYLGARDTDIIHIFPRDLLQFKAIPLFIGHQVVKSTLPIFAKTVVVSNNKYLGLDFFHQHLLDKFLRTELGKLLGKGDSDQVVDTKFPEECGLLLERSQQFYLMLAWIKDQSGVWPKRN